MKDKTAAAEKALYTYNTFTKGLDRLERYIVDRGQTGDRDFDRVLGDLLGEEFLASWDRE